MSPSKARANEAERTQTTNDVVPLPFSVEALRCLCCKQVLVGKNTEVILCRTVECHWSSSSKAVFHFELGCQNFCCFRSWDKLSYLVRSLNCPYLNGSAIADLLGIYFHHIFLYFQSFVSLQETDHIPTHEYVR